MLYSIDHDTFETMTRKNIIDTLAPEAKVTKKSLATMERDELESLWNTTAMLQLQKMDGEVELQMSRQERAMLIETVNEIAGRELVSNRMNTKSIVNKARRELGLDAEVEYQYLIEVADYDVSQLCDLCHASIHMLSEEWVQADEHEAPRPIISARKSGRRGIVAEFVRDMIAAGRYTQREIVAEGRERGLNPSTVRQYVYHRAMQTSKDNFFGQPAQLDENGRIHW